MITFENKYWAIHQYGTILNPSKVSELKKEGKDIPKEANLALEKEIIDISKLNESAVVVQMLSSAIVLRM